MLAQTIRCGIVARRRETVDHPFGTKKQWKHQGAFLMRGLDNVRAEFSLTALAHNLRQAINVLGVDAMMAAVRGVRRDAVRRLSRHHSRHLAP